jgi:hypothetical protein
LVKTIELTNPSKKLISYWVRLEGSEDFQIESDTVEIEAKSSLDFKVTLNPRVSKTV